MSVERKELSHLSRQKRTIEGPFYIPPVFKKGI